MKRRHIYLSVAISLFFTSCSYVKKRRYFKTKAIFDCASDCLSKFTYKDVDSNLELTVLVFNRSSINHLVYSPNFIIGVTKGKDTIGIIDKEFKGNIEMYDTVNVFSTEWNDFDIKRYQPALIAYKNKYENNLFCRVKIIYKGKISK